MISTRPLETSGPAAGSRSYVRWQTTLDALGQQADDLASRGAADSCQLSASSEGLATAGQGPELPVTLGELRTALSEIERSDDWLTDRPGVSLYQDRKGQVHLDVINFGGFILAGGHVASRSVNAW